MPARSSRSMRIKWVFPGSDRPHKSIWANLSAACEKACIGTGPNDAPSNLPRTTESLSRLPHPALSRRAPNTLERARTREESTEPLDVRSPPQLDVPPCNGTSIVDTEDQRAFNVDDFRRWWQQRLAGEAAQDRSQGQKLTHIAIALAGIALISSALALKGGAPTTPSVAPPPTISPGRRILVARPPIRRQTSGRCRLLGPPALRRLRLGSKRRPYRGSPPRRRGKLAILNLHGRCPYGRRGRCREPFWRENSV